MSAHRRPRKRKIALILLVVALIGFALVFNTSTRYGRWLFWQDVDIGDVERFAYRVVSNNKQSNRAFQKGQVPAAIRDVVDEYRINDESLEEFAANHESTAIIVVHDNEILLEKYFQGYHRESLQPSVSCTKSLMSLLVGIAMQEGLIDSVDDSISDYVHGLDSGFENVTIRHLMTMTSGISDANAELFGAIPAPWSDRVKAYYDPNLRRIARSFKRDHQPGTRFEYHDYNPILIGLMLQKVTGQNLSDYLSARIWQPVGMEFTARWSLDSRRHGFEKPDSGFNARAIDFARLGSALIDGNPQIVSSNWIQQSILDQQASELLQQRFAASAQRAEDRGQHDLAEHIRSLRYGFYWWSIEREGRVDYYANGHFGQFIYISPKARLVIVRHGRGHGGLNDWHFGNHFFRLASHVIAAELATRGTKGPN